MAFVVNVLRNISFANLLMSMFQYFWLLIVFLPTALPFQPHILFIVADDYGYHDVGYHGSAIKTPNIDQLANDGVRLENYYVQPVCTPSRSQLMTGRYQIHFGLQHNVIYAPQPNCLPLDEIMLPQKLKEVGYSTHALGKWHLGFYNEACRPTQRGFDTHYGFLAGKQDYFSKEETGSLGHWKYTGLFKGVDFHDNEVPVYNTTGIYSTYLYGSRVAKIVKSHNSSQPLFIYMAFQSVHDPLMAPQHYIDMYSHITDKNRRIYSGMVTAMDDAVGVIVDAFKERGIWENTLTVFTTDNGGETMFGGNNYPLRGRKASLWEGGVRGVGLIHGFGVQNPSRISRELMHVSDWFPTLIGVAGGNLNGTKPLDSYDVWKAISQGDRNSPRTEILHNIDPMFKRPYTPTPPLIPFPNDHGVDTMLGHTGLRMGNWKLLTGDPGYDHWDPVPTLYVNHTFNPNCSTKAGYDLTCSSINLEDTEPVPSLRLYDVVADPEERHDVSELFPEIVDIMLAKIAAYNKTAVPIQFPGGDVRCNPELRGDVWRPWT